MQLARLYEDKYSDKCPMVTRRSTRCADFIPDIHSVSGQSKSVSSSISPYKPWVPQQQPHGITQSSMSGSSGSAHPFKRITFNEMQLRRAKGLCFNCDEKFSPSHRCPNKRLLLLQWDEDNVAEEIVPQTDFTVEVDNSMTLEETPI